MGADAGSGVEVLSSWNSSEVFNDIVLREEE